MVTLVHQLSDVRVEIFVILLVFPLKSQNVATPIAIHEDKQYRKGICFLFAKFSIHSHRDVFTLFS